MGYSFNVVKAGFNKFTLTQNQEIYYVIFEFELKKNSTKSKNLEFGCERAY